MDFGLGTYALGFLAGVLSTLSPCVLPLVPILIASAVVQHRHGPLALAAGLTVSFALVGLLLATVGAALGIDPGVLRPFAAVLLIAFGAVMLSERLQQLFATATAGLSSGGQSLLGRVAGTGLGGQFGVGLLLGLVWTPCVGPTLGAATTLASQGTQLVQVALLMLLFGLGAGTPLVVLGTASRSAAQRWRGTLLTAGRKGKWLLGAVMVVLGLAILTGWDKVFETWVVAHAPQWLTDLTTRY
jgi:cytochrome c-type biogenesis protein